MPIHVVCPACETMLALSDAAPARLTCPRCLAQFENPASARPGQATPLRVIPVAPTERQFVQDSKAGMWAFIITAALLGVGGAAIAIQAGTVGSFIIAVIMIGAAAAMCVAVVAVHGKMARRSSPTTNARDVRPADGTIDYATPQPQQFRNSPLGVALRILLGIAAGATIMIVVAFLILLSLCAGAFR
jgi:hypothetical protein